MYVAYPATKSTDVQGLISMRAVENRDPIFIFYCFFGALMEPFYPVMGPLYLRGPRVRGVREHNQYSIPSHSHWSIPIPVY